MRSGLCRLTCHQRPHPPTPSRRCWPPLAARNCPGVRVSHSRPFLVGTRPVPPCTLRRLGAFLRPLPTSHPSTPVVMSPGHLPAHTAAAATTSFHCHDGSTPATFASFEEGASESLDCSDESATEQAESTADAVSFSGEGEAVGRRHPEQEVAPLANAELVARYLEGLMPKQEIGAKRFLEQHPHADGRGVLIAIFDSGVDPGAAGLQTTPQGQPKIVDVIDCTGSGDVDTSKVVQADAEGYITGASGRRLRVNKEWENPSGEWRVGAKPAFDLFNDSLLDRVKRERRKHWDVAHHALLTQAVRTFSAFDSKHPKGSWRDDSVKKQHEELQARVNALHSLDEGYEDAGPMLDAVVWHDGNTWRVALDTSDFYAAHLPQPNSTASTTAASTQLEQPASASGSSTIRPGGIPPGVKQDGESNGSSLRSGEGSGGGPREGSTPGRLEDFRPLADYSVEHEHRFFSDLDLCSYAVKVYEDGAVLSIVTECSSHGTHVAGIAAAYHPEEPSLNGIAPGAQILSCKIGDTRLLSMETSTAIVRALIAAVQHKCDLINMSYGEPVALTDKGRCIELANEVVQKHGIIFVSSAGNQGPALSTVLAPGGTCGGVIGVGAYVSQSLAAFGHSVIDTTHLEGGTQYTWSSRGPSPDGALGVAVSAPGGAVAPVPTSSLQRRQLMNGTSMASPCACGGIALLLSGLKAEAEQRKQQVQMSPAAASLIPTTPGPAWGPSLVRRAIENTALPMSVETSDSLTYGRGLLQVDRAYQYLLKSAFEQPHVSNVLRYSVSVSNARSGSTPPGRGVCLREAWEFESPSEWQVLVSPCLDEYGSPQNMDKASFEQKIQLVALIPKPTVLDVPGDNTLAGESESPIPNAVGGAEAPWLKVPEFVLLPYNGRSFSVLLDPTGLPAGALEYAEVCGLDLDAPWRGPLFRVPFTLIRPLPALSSPAPPSAGAVLDQQQGSGADVERPARAVSTRGRSTLPFKVAPGHVERVFLSVPPGATWMEISLRLDSVPTPVTLLAHTLQVLPQRRYTYRNQRSYLKFSTPSAKSLSCIVEGGYTLELALAQMWSSGSDPLQPCMGEATVEFHGLSVVYGDVFLNGNAAIQRMEVLAPTQLNTERLIPSISLSRVRTAHRPSDSVIRPLGSNRDTLPNGCQIHSLLLTYKFSISEPGRYTPRFPLLNQRLYDNEYEGQFYMLFDCNKMLLSQEDCYPKSVRLGKGDHVLRLQVRHDNTWHLERIRKMPLLLDRQLDEKSTLRLSLFSSVDAALTGSTSSFKSGLIFPGERKPLFLMGPAEDKLPKDASPGSLLLGRASLCKLGGAGSSHDAPSPARIHVNYLVPLSPKSDDSKNGGVLQDSLPVEERVKEQLRDAKVKALGTVAGEKEEGEKLFQAMAKELKAEYPTHLPLLLEILRFWDDPKLRGTHLKEVIAAADEVIGSVDPTKLALHFAMRTQPEGTAFLKERKEREAERDALVDALYRKGLALADLEKQQKGSGETSEIGGNDILGSGGSTKKNKEGATPAAATAAVLATPAPGEAAAAATTVLPTSIEPPEAALSAAKVSLNLPKTPELVGAATSTPPLAQDTTSSSDSWSNPEDGSFSSEYTIFSSDKLSQGQTASKTSSSNMQPPIVVEEKGDEGARSLEGGAQSLPGDPAPERPVSQEQMSLGRGAGNVLFQETAARAGSGAAPEPSPDEEPAAMQAGEGAGEGVQAAAGQERDEFEETYAELRKWADPSLPKHALLQVVRERRAGRLGMALKTLLHTLEDDTKVTDKKLQDLLVELLEEAEWTLWADQQASWNRIRFPGAYPLF